MQTKIKAIYPQKQELKIVEIFGYATKGIPGIEILCGGKQNKLLKEKFIFLIRRAGIRLPLKRFVLCIEENVKDDGITFLELPLFILLLSLAETLPIHHLDDCLCSGRVFISGKLNPFSLGQSFLQENFTFFENDKILGSEKQKSFLLPIIPLELLFEKYPQFSIEV